MMKRKYIFRAALTIMVALVVVGITAIAVLRSAAVHRYVLAKMIERASQATGGRVEIGDFRFRWSGLRIDIDQIVLHGSESATHPPLLRVDHVMVGLKIISLWRHKIDLNEIVIDHPSIHLSVDQSGHSNLAKGPPSAGGRSGNLFDLAIGHVVVNQGEVNYNDRRVPLDGEVHDLHALVTFNSAKTQYDGAFGYRDGRVKFGSFNPVQHGVEVHFGAAASGLNVDSLVLNAGSSTVSAQGHLKDYANPSVDGSYQADISTGELGKILKATPFPAGLVNARGSLHFQNRAGHPVLDNLTTAGQFRCQALALTMPQVRTTVRALTGEYRLEGGTLEARNVHGDAMGGKVSGSLTLTHLSKRPVARFAAQARDVSLQAVSAALDMQPAERAAIGGNVNGTADGSWEGAGKNFQLHSDATIAGAAPVQPGAGSSTNVIPLRGELHLAYDGRSGVISLNHSQLTTSHLTVRVDGSTGKQSSLGIQAQSDDLREVDQIVLIVRHAMAGSRPSSANPIEPLGIGGSGTFDGKLSGSIEDLHLTGQLASTSLQYRQTNMTDLQASVAVSPSDLTLSKGRLRTGDHGQVQFDLAAGLTNWSYTPQSPVRLDLTAAKLPVATLQQLASLHYPVSGTLAAHISMHGSQSNAIGQGTVTLTQASVWGQPVQSLSAQFQGAGDTVNSTVQLSTAAGSGSGKLTYDFRTQGYDAQFSLPSVRLERLEVAHYKDIQMSGVVSASLQGRGTLKDPQLAATLQAPKLAIGQQSLDAVKLHADVAHRQATFALDSAAVGASIQARGTVGLTGNYPTQASLDVRNIQLGALLPVFLPQAPSDLRGQAELHGTFHGPLKQREQLEAEVDIPSLSLSYQSLQIANASPIRAAYRANVITLNRFDLKGSGTELQLQAAVPLEHGRSLQASAVGNIDLRLVSSVYPQCASSGQLHLDLVAEGSLPKPDVHGTVRLTDAGIQGPDTPLGAQNVNAAMTIKNGRVEIQSFTGQSGGGTLSAEGFATFQPAVQFNMTLTAKQVRLRYPVGTRAILDGNLLLTGSADSALISGRVIVDRLSLTRDFDLATFANQFTGSSSPSTAPSFVQNAKLNVSVTSASEMALASSKLSVQGSADLMVRGTAAEPVILGRTDITGGEIFFNGNRYKVESGVVQFVNPVRTEPIVNVLVTTTVDQFNLSMNFTGPIDRLRTTYTSDPPLAPIDIINLLATGQTTEAASTTATSPESVIAGQLTSQLSSRVEKLAGITSLTIDPQVGGAQGSGGGRLAVQQRVTKNLFFTFSTDLTTSTGQIVQIEYQVSQRFAVSTIRDQNGGYTVQVKVHKRF